MKKFIENFRKNSEFGLVLDWHFHVRNKWVSAYSPFLIDAIIKEFDPIIIGSQISYEIMKRKLKYILSFEPGSASPNIRYDRTIPCRKGIVYSDPHYKSTERMDFAEKYKFDFILSLYKKPFFRHFSGFDKKKFIHWPWAVPDQFITSHALHSRSSEVAIFGGSNSDAYDVRNWCREQPCVTNYDFSGVENKKLSNSKFYEWLSGFDAIVAAGSSNPDFDLVTPKYFEIVAAGALLIGQYCDDLFELGFSDDNALLFTKDDFVAKVERYRRAPEKYLEHRIRGRNLIKERHKLSDRINSLREAFYER